jgi:P27 family predicted phage terminase small subunit
VARGRPRKPLPALLLEGRFRADRHGEAGSTWQPETAAAIDAPDWLSPDAKRLWQALAPSLSNAGIATEVDESELAALCDWWSRYREASRELDKLENRRSTEYYRLAILTSMAWKNFSSAASKFGLNPSDRARLRLTNEDESIDPLQDFVKDAK